MLGEVAEHFLKRALVTTPTKRFGMKEHVFSWPFLDQILKPARIGNHYATDFMCRIRPVFIARD